MSRTIALLLAFAIISLYIGHYADDRTYYIGAQVNECLLLLAIVVNVVGFTRDLAMSLLILATLELIDEIAGRNTSIYVNDYIPVIIALIYLSWRILKRK